MQYHAGNTGQALSRMSGAGEYKGSDCRMAYSNPNSQSVKLLPGLIESAMQKCPGAQDNMPYHILSKQPCSPCSFNV